MDIQTLRLFVAAAERLNISAAGRSLGLAPAMASARLAKLEHELGAELLHRTTRKVSLSQEGAAFLPYAREILAQSEAGRAALGLNAKKPSGTLRFAAPSSFAQLHIMPLLPAFHAAYPDITLDLRLSDTRVADLDGHDLLSWGTAAPRQFAAGAERFTLDPRRMICRTILNDGTAQRIATLAGGGISVNSLWSVAADIRAGRLVHLLPDWRLDDASVLWLIYPQSNVLTPKVRVFMDFLLAQLTPAPWGAAATGSG